MLKKITYNVTSVALFTLASAASLMSAISMASYGNAQELRNDIVIEHFESGSYKSWEVSGNAFGDMPAKGTLPNQNIVSGFQGKGLANSFSGSDATTGTLTSPEFRIDRKYITFLIGGGRKEGKVGIELSIEGELTYSCTGDNSEELLLEIWDVSEHAGKKGQIRIFDNDSEGWGHICVDSILQTDKPPERFGLSAKLDAYRKTAQYMNEPLRPQFHFSPELNWMNDPNGLVFHNGEYHLFYQYNPAGNEWGHMSWGHAVSKDMVHWEHLPIAIPEKDGVMAFSGSCVVDHRNSSRFGTGGKPPMVAIFTGHKPGKQVQNLAYSNDDGRTWEFYAGNPVLDLGLADFRDPKVFWHQDTKQWIMVVSLATERVIAFFGSDDLKDWKELSRFGPAGVRSKPNWECPDLFELPVENENGKRLWVLEADMGDGSIAGGSGGEYFVGHFDGIRFTTIQHSQWVDYGRDFYAPISFENFPNTDNRRVWLGWFNNWQTCLIPTQPWRGSMSVPRELSLRKVAFNSEEPATYVLVQKPIREFSKLHSESTSLDTRQLGWPPRRITQPGEIQEMQFELTAEWKPARARSLGFRIHTGEDEYTEIGYDSQFLSAYVDRTKSGNVSFHPAFSGRHNAPARLIDGKISVRVLVDRSSVEVFVNDGEAVISDQIFPTNQKPWIEAFVGDKSAEISQTHVIEIKSAWHSTP
ncbi:MAG: glycoside hydrolase family 32 protein [Pirellula sp.]|jgi:fructan beta-fructosidase